MSPTSNDCYWEQTSCENIFFLVDLSSKWLLLPDLMTSSSCTRPTHHSLYLSFGRIDKDIYNQLLKDFPWITYLIFSNPAQPMVSVAIFPPVDVLYGSTLAALPWTSCVAKHVFAHLQEPRIICLSHSKWASLLHMAPKAMVNEALWGFQVAQPGIHA